MPTRRGFLASLFVAPFAAKAVSELAPTEQIVNGQALHDCMISSFTGAPPTARLVAPINMFKLGQPVTIAFQGVTQFSGVVDSVMNDITGGTQHVECRDWNSYSKTLQREFTDDLMRQIRMARVNL